MLGPYGLHLLRSPYGSHLISLERLAGTLALRIGLCSRTSSLDGPQHCGCKNTIEIDAFVSRFREPTESIKKCSVACGNLLVPRIHALIRENRAFPCIEPLSTTVFHLTEAWLLQREIRHEICRVVRYPSGVLDGSPGARTRTCAISDKLEFTANDSETF